ncbi:Cna B-type domain-containing protein [Slackia piriformis]|uniref:Cna B-type domain-containing protein n=1 Tax=Slackia piriformis TaxID=626934 RepID=UPI0026DACD6E|nr:Cna B-type domain-containing protein [Slackia piriformis]MDO5024093.1 Cna B-type domain-containing protein [Slackia piriformis]
MPILSLLSKISHRGGLSEVEGFDLSFFDSVFPPIAFFDEAPVDGGSSDESGSNGDGSDAAAPNEGAPDNNTSNGEDSNEGTPDENASGEESLEGNASDEVSDAEQDAAQIEGAEVLQQGDGETTGNVLVADRAAVDALGGRDFAGQVVKNINGTKYILIGNAEQLRKIGSGDSVHTAVYQAKLKGVHWEVDKDKDGNPIMLYGGDADLLASQNGNKDYSFGGIEEADGGFLETVGRCGVNQETGEIDPDMNIKDSGATYAADANYIIFRDIDLAGTAWEPLMFSGTMLGAKAADAAVKGGLWGGIKEDGSGITDVTAVANPVISNVNVVQADAKLDVSKHTGIGFFGTISNKLDDKDPFAAPTKATVSNITLEKVSVENHATEVRVDQSLISGLLGVLGGLVGGILSTLLEILTLGKLSLDGLIENLLNVRAADPSSLATGAFAGRVVGDVEVSGCEVHEAKVSSAAQMNGGFVGYAQGDTVYSILSKALEDIVKLLTNILNIIPGLGLGDLITLLLDSNIIKAGELLPVDYLNPVISHCSVHNFAEGEVIGSADNDYAGGFAGVMVGTIAQECSVESINPYTVTGRLYAGGFAGLMRNDVMKGALSEVGVELVRVAQPQSAAAGCAVRSGVTVTAASYAGGFAGAMANSYAVDASVEGAANVSATGHEEEHDGKRSIKALAGGFTGAATVGWATDLGQGENKNSDLLTGVNGLLTGLLTSDPEAAQNLLSLVGVEESKLLGVQMKGDFTVHSANDFAGGMVGRGDGAVIAASDDLHVSDIKLWSQGTVSHAASGMGCSIEGLRSVSADGSYAGGIAGGLGTASVGGVLNTTIGLGGYLPFNVSSTTVSGVTDGFTVTAGDSCAAGGIGKATGGKIGRADDAYESAAAAPTTSVVNISNIKLVAAKNNAGGFAGLVGPGDLASTGGLDLLGLGALKLNGLLSVADGLEVKMDGVTVSGVPAGMAVEATGNNDADGGTTRFAAAGFIASANSAEVTDGHVKNLASVTAHLEDGVAGGFVGVSRTGGLADVADEAAIKGLLSANNLLNAVGYMIPSYSNVDVSYINGGAVSADMAGGFAGDFQSGTVENPEGSPWAVYNIAQITGGSYAGGFGGKVTSGALAAADGGVSILGGIADLSIGVDELLGVMGAYVPSITNAGVKSDASTVEATSGAAIPDEKNPGLVVTSTRMDALDSQSGSAGGFIGYGSGVQVSNCDVTQLRHTGVVEPAELEGADGSSYFNGQSAYAVKAPRYAGGYMGKMDVGSAASVGKGLNVLGQTIKLTDIAGALSVVVSTIEHSDVNGGTGGFAVLATETSLPEGDLGDGSADPGSAANPVGSAGGFVGEVKGGHIQDSNSYNFSYIVGQVKAGGYAGGIAPGDVASVLADNTSILKGLISTNGTLASLVQDFVPTIRNSETTSVPCGGAVRAQAASDKLALRGMAGGYVGHNEGGHIWGNSNASWKKENDGSNHYTGTQRVAAAERIRSVYGAEFAGGFTGLLEPADTASTGNLSLLFGLVEVNNLLGALEVTYPTQENTEVTGPLRGMPFESWNAWAEHVGSQGGYGPQIGDAANNVFGSQEEFDNFVASYIYGTNVVAGRTAHSTEANASRGGIAGGYVGLMHGGVVTHGQATDTKTVSALRAAGGFAGSMETADAASLGSVDLLNLISLNLDSLVSALDVLVPVVKSSSITGYRKGMTVTATGTDTALEQGFAGGYVGYASGAQIWGDATFADADKDGDRWTTGATHEGAQATGCNVENLRKVSGANCIGGYAGIVTAAGVADVNTNGASSGLLQKLLDTLIGTPSSIASVLNATVSTVRGASVSAVDEATDQAASAWGFTIEGAYGNADARKYARAAGGFAGSAKAVVVGTQEGGTSGLDTVSVNGLRGVEGGQYAGGFVGQADVTGVASVAGSTEGDQSTNLLLGLIKAGNIAAVDAFRPYFYHANVDGVADGFQVRANDSSTQGILSSKQFTGTAGGFAGSVVNGSVKDCAVTDLMSVSGVNYTGGFVGHLGKAGTVDVDNVGVNKLLGATAGVLDVWGAHVERSTVMGVADGYTVTSTHNGADYGLGTDAASGREVAGGFVGYTDLARVNDCDAGNLKLVNSGEIAGGFAGEALRAHLVEAEVSSPLLDLVLLIVNALLKVLYIPGLENLGLINLGDWFGIGKIFDLKVLADGDAVYVNLFGLKIGVSLSKASSENQQETDVAIITIGDSTIKLPCTEAGITDTENAKSNLTVELIKGNRARVEGCSVTGVVSGYDVFGGGASQNADGVVDRATGYAGGFSGLNDEGVLYHNDMYYADVVRGTAEKVDPFANTKLKSVWDFNSMEDIVGPDDANNYNVYRVYRSHVDGSTAAVTKGNALITGGTLDTGEGTANTGLDRYDVEFFHIVNCFDQDIANSGASGDEGMKWIGMKDAQRTGDGGFKEALGVYASPAKAVLMLDTAQTGNGGALTPEPGEGQDPCEARVDVTIQKIWNDAGDKEGLRPDAIRVQLVGSYTDGAGEKIVPNELIVQDGNGTTTETIANPQQVDLTEADNASGWTETWRKVVAGLPVAFADEDGAIHYYTYEASEVQVLVDGTWKSLEEAGYTVTYHVDGTNPDHVEDRVGVIEITNTHLPMLPETGGSGLWMLILLALVLLGGGALWRKRRSMIAAQETAFAQSLGMRPVGSFVASSIKPAGAHARQPERASLFNLPRI